MENKEETRTCGQCHKDVAEANFALHETHCKRFLCPCPDCGESVHRELLDKHREEEHAQVRCSKCNKKMEHRHLKDHESDECVERLQSCQFCELELPHKELDEHSLACGSRTERCLECGRYVTLKDRAEHELTCSAADDDSAAPQTSSKPPSNERVTVMCNRCMKSIPAEDLDDHELECFPTTRLDNEEAAPEEEESDDEDDFYSVGETTWLSSTFKANSLSDKPSRGPWGDEGDPDQISTCPHCHLALPNFTLRWHTVKCQIHILLK